MRLLSDRSLSWRWWPALPFAALVLIASHGLVWELSSPSADRPDRSDASHQSSSHANENTSSDISGAVAAWSAFFLTWITGFLGYMAWEQRKTSRAQLRAYIAPREAALRTHPSSLTVGAEITLKNVGNTPATDVVCVAALSIQTWPQASVLRVGGIVLPGGVPTTKMALWPMDEVTLRPGGGITLTTADQHGLGDETKAIYLNGTIEYLDSFGMRHTTGFSRFKTGTNWRRSSGMGISPLGNDTRSEKAKK